MEKKDGYKKTEIGWIPEDWDVVRLGDIGFFKNGINKGKEDFGHGVPFVNLMDVFGNISIKNKKFGLVSASSQEQQNYNLLKGDVLFIRSSVKPSGVGLTVLVEQDLSDTIYSGFLIRYRPEKNQLDHGYKKYCFYDETFRRRLLAKSSVSANTNINQNALSSLLLKQPPLPEQTKIANILTTVDDKISSIDSQIQQTEQLKKGLMEKLLTEGIGHTEFKETEIGRVPVGWEVITIGQIVKKIVGGGTPSRERFDYYNGDIPWITVKDLASNSFYKNSAIEHISEEGLQNSSANLIHCENIIIATRMGLGRGFINTIDMAINQDMKALYLDREKVSNRFFLFWYLSKSSFIETLGTGTTVKGISLPTLKKLALPFPPLPEQKQIATILSTVDDKLDILNQKKSQYQTLKKGLSQQLLTGQMRVKV